MAVLKNTNCPAKNPSYLYADEKNKYVAGLGSQRSQNITVLRRGYQRLPSLESH